MFRKRTWTDGSPRIGIFITPDGATSGEIETLVWRAWAADAANSDVRTCIEKFRDCMQTAGHVARSPEKGLITFIACHSKR